jgi:hypothetical protein
MRKYKSVYEDHDLLLIQEQEKGLLVCSDQLFEAVINPEEYTDNLVEILDKNKKILEQQTHPEDLCKLLSNLYYSHKIIFKVFSSDNNLMIYSGSSDDENIYIRCTPAIIEAYDKYEEFKNQFEKYLKHELIHRYQFLKMKSDSVIKQIIRKSRRDQISYYGSPQEIMAYAWQIINDFRMTGKSDEVIKQLISKDSFIATRYSAPLEMYKRLFQENSEVLNRLYKYMYEYLNQ